MEGSPQEGQNIQVFPMKEGAIGHSRVKRIDKSCIASSIHMFPGAVQVV